MGSQCDNLLKLLMFRFNITFWVQIFRMTSFLDVCFHYLNLQKLKQFVFCQFLLKFILRKIWKPSICESLSCKVFLISLFQFFALYNLMFPINYLKKNFKNFMIRKSLSCKMFYIAQFAKVYTKIWIAPPSSRKFL